MDGGVVGKLQADPNFGDRLATEPRRHCGSQATGYPYWRRCVVAYGAYYTRSPVSSRHHSEVAFREFESACEQSPTCAALKGLERFKCVRECISPTCYHHIYYKDQIEEGEIDVRLNSFKGCFIQRTGRTR
ncbi:uncharacterized protein LOC128995509 [Macrosteles quadrilineatus]|uniref:uncharacterized protein LOC128995509 n=1 Tax=Macrosteles quadrilineatus TaxID=74068 RepID=UPI0023E2DECC|nr:uncharacterized protein LOC128995509 [Macrosteles quadrilineatus]